MAETEGYKSALNVQKGIIQLPSVNPNAFIRPSPAAGTLGGVARKTGETIICNYKG